MVSEQALNYLPLIIYVIAVMITVGAMLGISFVLGQRHNDRATNEPYESGILITGSARTRFPSKFYLVAMFFVIFDLESVFLFAWSTAVREIGWAGYIQVLIFVFVLVVSLIYIWSTGGLEFAPPLRKISKTKEGKHNVKY